MNKNQLKTSLSVSVLSFILFFSLKIDLLDSISWAITCGSLCFACYDKYLWTFLPWEKTPRIKGTYTAYCESDFNGKYQYQSTVKIKQNLSSIKVIEFLDDGSYCESIFASLYQSDPDSCWTLHYTYQTRPNPTPTDDMHLGTTLLTLQPDGCLKGFYYTNRLQQTKGSMHLVRK